MASAAPAASASPAVLVPEPQSPPPAYTQSAKQSVDTEHYLQQQRELDRKAKELEDRESDLRRRDEQLRQQQQQQQQQQGVSGATSKNWPPLPKWIPIKPCFYQDVEVEIPHAFQHIVKQMYYLWMLHVVLYFLNFIGGLGVLFKGL